MKTVIVIGAGMGGLSTAIRLGASGMAVTVYEQASRTGGKLQYAQVNGFRFDTGPHLLTLPAVYRDLFANTGAPLEDVVDLRPVDPAFHYRFADGIELDIPNVSRPAIAAAWDQALGGGAGADWTNFLQRASRIWDAAREPFLNTPLDGARTLLAMSRKRFGDIATIAPWRSLRGLGRQYLNHPHQRMALERYATYTGSDPRRAPAALATVPFVEQAFGAWYVMGGLHALGEAVRDRALEVGATIHCDTKVERILTEGNRAVGVRLADGTEHRADVIVANADAHQVYQYLLPEHPAAQSALMGVRKAGPSLSGFALLLGLKGRTENLRHHTVLFGSDYDQEFDSIFGRGEHRGAPRPVPDPTVYIAAPDDPALRPDDDHESWFVLVNAPRHQASDEVASRFPLGSRTKWAGVDWRAEGLAEEYAQHVLDVMAQRGMDVRDRIVNMTIRTPADIEADTLTVGGSIYGTSSDGARAAFLRPSNASPIEALFLASGSAHPGGGLPLVGMSAQIVSRLVREYLRG